MRGVLYKNADPCVTFYMQENPQREAFEQNRKEYMDMEIQLLRQTINGMGANDSELSQLQKIIEDVNAGIMAPEDAIAKEKEILAGKMDYH